MKWTMTPIEESQLIKRDKYNWSKFKSCGTCISLRATKRLGGICENPNSVFYKKDMPCWYGCHAWKE